MDSTTCVLTGLVRGRTWRIAIAPVPPFRLAAYDDRTLWVPAVLGLWSPRRQRMLVQPSMGWWSPTQGDSALLEALSDFIAGELRGGLQCLETVPPGYAELGPQVTRLARQEEP